MWGWFTTLSEPAKWWEVLRVKRHIVHEVLSTVVTPFMTVIVRNDLIDQQVNGWPGQGTDLGEGLRVAGIFLDNSLTFLGIRGYAETTIFPIKLAFS